MAEATNNRALRGRVAVAGIGLTPGWNQPGLSSLDQLAQAVHAAAADAGIGVHEIDGLFAATQSQQMPVPSVAEYLGLSPRFVDGTQLGGASPISHLLSALLALDAGLCDVACLCYGSNQLSASGRLASLAEPQSWESPYQPRLPVSAYALAAARHMHEYGTTREQLAEVAVAARRWAQLNDEAFERAPLTIADVIASRLLSDPLRLRDCCLVTDGGAAVILVRAERARLMPQPPIYLLGTGVATTHRQISSMPSLTTTPAVESGRRAFAMAGLSARDVNIAQLYDAFTINPILFLEDLGFCAKGEGGAFVEDGGIAPGGRLPVNTNGGGLSCCHPGMYGLFTIVETVRQLRGSAGTRQVPGAAVGLAHANGGLFSAQATAILGRAEAL